MALFSFGSKSTPPIPAVPAHVAIIMDGNGRWAGRRMLPRVEGHRAGAKSVRVVVEESRRLGIKYLSLFAFSTENWQRPADEVDSLMKLFVQYLESELALLIKNDIRLRAIGDLSRISSPVRQRLEQAIEKTASGRSLDLILALSYGGRDEIVRAAKAIAQEVKEDRLSVAAIDEQVLRQHLFAPDVPDPDLLIRTSGECRISNFLLWQLAYAEIVVSEVLWPDFGKEEFLRCLAEYSTRERRFGLTESQIKTPKVLSTAG